jgi:hypothetical protein
MLFQKDQTRLNAMNQAYDDELQLWCYSKLSKREEERGRWDTYKVQSLHPTRRQITECRSISAKTFSRSGETFIFVSCETAISLGSAIHHALSARRKEEISLACCYQYLYSMNNRIAD